MIKNKDIYKTKVDLLTIRGGITSHNKSSIILGMPSVKNEDLYTVLKIDGKEKLDAIIECISSIYKEGGEEIN